MELLSNEALNAFIQAHPQWAVINEEMVDKKICREFVFDDFAKAFAFMIKVAEEAERINHHPDWKNSYNRVWVELTTHSENGLTRLDIALAVYMDELVSQH